MLDLSALDNEFSGMTRSDILRALLEAADGDHAEFTDVDDGRGRLAATFADDDADGRWVTIEGAHVFIGKGGMIEKGPAHLVGKKPEDLAARGKGPNGDHAGLHGAAKAHDDAREAYRAAIAKHKAERQNAHTEEGMHAQVRLENAVRHAQKMYDIANTIEFDDQDRPEAEEAYNSLDSALHSLIHGETGSEMRGDLAEVIEAAGTLRDAKDAMPQNKADAEKILAMAKSVKAELKAHADHRRTMKAIREGDAANFADNNRGRLVTTEADDADAS